MIVMMPNPQVTLPCKASWWQSQSYCGRVAYSNNCRRAMAVVVAVSIALMVTVAIVVGAIGYCDDYQYHDGYGYYYD